MPGAGSSGSNFKSPVGPESKRRPVGESTANLVLVKAPETFIDGYIDLYCQFSTILDLDQIMVTADITIGICHGQCGYE